MTNGGIMQGYNCIIVYNSDKDKLLFCKRSKAPYKGLYNFVGGKIEAEEDGFYFYNQDCYVEVYV